MTKEVLLVFNPKHVLHDGKMNECAARVEAVQKELQSRGLWSQCRLLDASTFSGQEIGVTSVHSTAHHLTALRTGYTRATHWNCPLCTFANPRTHDTCQLCASSRGGESDFVIPANKSDVYLCAQSVPVALANCQACCHAARQCLDDTKKTTRSAFCLVRPPGHHASAEHYGSYCLLNTIAVVAKNLQKEGKRVLIVDWDVHHGDGTQAVIENDSELAQSCRFISIHRHDENFWPKSGRIDDSSNDSIINVPLTGTGYGDADYYAIFQRVVLPLARQFEPDIILVSAGYDCAMGDALGRFHVSSGAFTVLARMLLTVAPSMFILEGGYDVEANNAERPHGPLRDGVASTVEGLLHAAKEEMVTVPALPDGWRTQIKEETHAVIRRVAEKHCVL